MKKLRTATVTVAAGIMIGFGAPLIHAEKAADAVFPDHEITITGKKPARFKHAIHIKMGLECGRCHHDAEHQPLTAAAIGALANPSQLACVACHNNNFADRKLRRAKAVFHARCRTCHQKGISGKKGPTKCRSCHIKQKRRAIEGC